MITMTYMFKVIHYYLQMCSKTLETNVLKYMNLILLIFYQHQDYMASLFKKDRSKIKIINRLDMLLMVEKGIRGGICDAIHRYAKANNKCRKNYDKNIEPSYLIFLDANNLYGWTMSQRLPIKWF